MRQNACLAGIHRARVGTPALNIPMWRHVPAISVLRKEKEKERFKAVFSYTVQIVIKSLFRFA